MVKFLILGIKALIPNNYFIDEFSENLTDVSKDFRFWRISFGKTQKSIVFFGSSEKLLLNRTPPLPNTLYSFPLPH